MQVRGVVVLALTLCACVATRDVAPAAVAIDRVADESAIRDVLLQGGVLIDPLADSSFETTFGSLRVTPHEHSGEPRLEFAWAHGCEADEADVRIERWITGTIDIRDGRHAFTKAVRDSAVRLVHLQRSRTDGQWHVATLSPVVTSTPRGHAELPMASLDTALGSRGFLSVVSDLDELSVCPQTCAVAGPGGLVTVRVAGVPADAVVMVFAAGQRVAASSDGGSHFEATVHVSGAGLRSVGVTVYSRRSLVDRHVSADERTWVMPLLVRSSRPGAQALAFEL